MQSLRSIGSTLTLLALAVWVSAASGADTPQLTIERPGGDEYITGLTKLSASVDPVASVTTVAFFADGREVCTVTAAPFECDWDAGRLLKEHHVRVVATLASGQRVVKTVMTQGIQGFAESVDVNAVQVTVSVTDAQGRFIRGLPRSAFRVFEDGQQQPLSHFAAENVPLDLVVALDISGSMEPTMPKLKSAVKAFLGSVPEGNQVTLLGFNDTMFTLSRRATAVADRLRAVDRLSAWGATSLYDVIIKSVEMLGTHAGRKALVLFSDGEDQGSFASMADVERRLQGSDVNLYIIAQGAGLTNAPLKTLMSRLAVPTGGRAIFTDRIDELHGVFGQLLDELSNQYLLGYSQPDPRRDGRWRRIKVEVDGYQRIRARQGYRVARK